MSARRVSRSLCIAASAAVTLVVGLVTPAAAVAAPEAPAETVTAISPTSGSIGTQVTVHGSGFTAPTAVLFTGATVPLTSLRSAAVLGVTVPAGAATGPVSVQFADGSVSAGVFTVTTGIVVGPRGGPAGATTTVKGAGYQAGETVVVGTAGRTLGQSVATSTGSFVTTVVIPRSAPNGAVTLTATGTSSHRRSRAQYTVGWDWTFDGGDATHSRSDPFERTLTAATVAHLAVRWRVPGADPGTPAVVAGGRVYVVTRFSGLRAYDATTGASLWTTDDDVEGVMGTAAPAVADGVLYHAGFFDNRYHLTARDAATGAVRWRRDIMQSYGSAVVADGRVYLGDSKHILSAFDAATGALQWTASAQDFLDSAVATDGGTVYFGSNDGYLRAVDAVTGERTWIRGFARDNKNHSAAFRASPAVVDGVVYAETTEGAVFAFRASDGATLWKRDVGRVDVTGEVSPAVAGGVVYVSSNQHSLLALDAHSGATRWSFALPHDVASAPTVAGGVVYVGTAFGAYHALDARSGRELWSYDGTSEGVASPPVVSNGLVYLRLGDDVSLAAFGLPR